MDLFSKENKVVAKCLQPLLHQERRVYIGDGAVAYVGESFERRLAALLEITDRLRSADGLALVPPLVVKINAEWQHERLNVDDAVAAVRAIDAATWPPVANLKGARAILYGALLDRATKGCWSSELEEIMALVDLTDDVDGSLRAILLEAVQIYCQDYFSDELRECNTSRNFQGLIESLELFKSELGVNLDYQINRVEEGRAEFEDAEEARAEHMADEWRDRHHADRAEQGSVRDLFDTLRSDRG